MAEILVKLVRFNLRSDCAEWLALNDKLTRAGMHLHVENDPYVLLPQAGTIRLEALDYNYLDETLRTVWDFCAIRMGRMMCGYYLELPPGCQPAPLDPARADKVLGSNESKYKQAVRWLCAAPGRTQQQAADMYGIKQGNVSLYLRRMRAAGEI